MNADQDLAAALLVLLVLSAWNVTSRAAVWVGLMLLLIVVLSTVQTGSLKAFGNELFSKPGGGTL